MTPTISLQRMRDRKESDLKTYEEQVKASEIEGRRFKKDFDQRLARYLDWCKTEGVEPIYYKVIT